MTDKPKPPEVPPVAIVVDGETYVREDAVAGYPMPSPDELETMYREHLRRKAQN